MPMKRAFYGVIKRQPPAYNHSSMKTHTTIRTLDQSIFGLRGVQF